MVEAGINERFWEYAILHAALLHNVLPSSKLPDEISPYEALKGKQPDVSKFKTWGCTAWHHLHDHERKNKISPVAVPSIHLGFDPQRNGYIIFLPHQNKISSTSSYHLTFQESRFMKFKDNEYLGHFRRSFCTEHQISGFPNKLNPRYRICCPPLGASNAPRTSARRSRGGSRRRSRVREGVGVQQSLRTRADGRCCNIRDVKVDAPDGPARPPGCLRPRRCGRRGR